MDASPEEPRVPRGRRFYALLRSNWISAAGTAVVTLAFFAMVTAYVFMSLGLYRGPYAGIVTFLVLPGLFALGLLIIPVGLLVYRNQLGERVQVLASRPVQWLPTLAVLTLVNVLIIAFGGYEGAHHMSSVQFCGATCHSVMQPEYDTYFTSPHSEVACVECHVGSGASWYLKTKVNGVHQAIATLTDSYERPIPTPVHDLRSAHETCTECHDRDRNFGDRLRVHWHFEKDEASTPYANVLLLRVGGQEGEARASGIHWHAYSGVEITYAATPDRSDIPWVEARYPDGTRRVFTREGTDPSPPAPETLRSMDCVDCHNRASHVFDDIEGALDRELAAGRLSRTLPAIKQRAAEILAGEWPREEARARIGELLEEAYPAGDEAVQRDVRDAARLLGDLWMRNVYPDRKVHFGSYPPLSGHDGCMRCHDYEHVDPEGRAISMDCTLCHAVLAMEESEPAILEELGLEVLR